jgi:predicted nucleic acid-binding protein
MAEDRTTGRPRSAMDVIIGMTATAHGLTVVTANERHLRDVGVR